MKEYSILKEEHHCTTDHKIKFMGYGEWVEEPDFVEFEYLGYHAMIARSLNLESYAKEEVYFGGYLCGYVRVPDSHPFFRNKDKISGLECHGGVTFNESHEEHWIGFDCAHSRDYVPTIEHYYKTIPEMIEIRARRNQYIPQGMEDHYLFNPVYRNIEFCTQECMKLITQLLKAVT